jgi:hypothetical protein
MDSSSFYNIYKSSVSRVEHIYFEFHLSSNVISAGRCLVLDRVLLMCLRLVAKKWTSQYDVISLLDEDIEVHMESNRLCFSSRFTQQGPEFMPTMQTALPEA